MKSTRLAWAAVFALTLIAAGMSPVRAQGRKNDGKKPAAAVIEAEDALKPGQMAGKIGQVADNVFTLRVEFNRLELKQTNGRPATGRNNNANQARNQQRLLQAQRRLQTARTPQQQMAAMRGLQQVQTQMQRQASQGGGRGGQSPFKVVKDFKDFEIDMSTTVDVRTMFVPAVYDEKGNFKKYTAAELRALKGSDASAPGYKSDTTFLKAGQKVVVTLARNKNTENKLQATRIVVTEESTDPEPAKKGGKKK